MAIKPSTKKTGKDKKDKEISAEYTSHNNPLDFYVGEDKASYGGAKPFSVYYDDRLDDYCPL